MLTSYIITFLSLTIVSVIVYGFDKIRSMNNGLRVPEVVLIILMALGGVFGAVLGMIFFNHKSNMSHKWYFFVVIATSIIVQVAIILACLNVI